MEGYLYQDKKVQGPPLQKVLSEENIKVSSNFVLMTFAYNHYVLISFVMLESKNYLAEQLRKNQILEERFHHVQCLKKQTIQDPLNKGK